MGEREYRRYRGGRVREKQADGGALQRQSDFLTFQIILVAALLAAAWGVRTFFPAAFETVRRVGEGVLTGDELLTGELLSPPDLETELRERFGIDLSPVTGFLARYGIGKPDYPATLGDSDGGGRGGVNPAQSADLSPLLLTAKPRVPVGGTVTSRFGWRDNPLSPGEADFHTGLDIAAPAGTVIHAALPGTVADVGVSESYGNFVLVDHVGGLQTFYCHCSETIARAGEVVRAGERLALVGSTGNVTGPHLHFEIRRDSRSCDPLVQLL